MSDVKEFIQKLEMQAGGLNWATDEPSFNEFKALKNWEFNGKELQAQLGYSVVHTSSSAPEAFCQTPYKASNGLEYAVFIKKKSAGVFAPFATLMNGTATSAATQWDWNEVFDLAATTVTQSVSRSGDATAFQVRDKLLLFAGYNAITQNTVIEYNIATTSDFQARRMGIIAPNTPVVAEAISVGSYSGTYRYKATWLRKDASGNILSESGGNTATTGNYYTEVNAASVEEVNVTCAATTSDAQVTHMRIYRTKNLENPYNDSALYYKRTGTNFTDDYAVSFTGGVGEASFTLNDTLSDDDLWARANSVVLVNELSIPFPKCKHGCYSGGRVWCSDENYIYYSSGSQDQGGLEVYDPRYDFLPVNNSDGATVENLLAYNGNVVVVTSSKTGVILNSDPANGIQWTDVDIGSIHKTSFVSTPLGIIACTNKGVLVHDGTRWDRNDIGQKIFRYNTTEGTHRLLMLSTKSDAAGGTYPFIPYLSAFFYNNKYYLRVWIGDLASTTRKSLVFDPAFGWYETGLNWDAAVNYDNGNKLFAYLRDTNDSMTFFTSTTHNGTAIQGTLQTGYFDGQEKDVELKEGYLLGKLSSAISFFTKSVDAVHCSVTDVKPSPATCSSSRKYLLFSTGLKSSEKISFKLKGNISAGNITYGSSGDRINGIMIKGRTSERYNHNYNNNFGMLARYEFEQNLLDTSGNSKTLTALLGGTEGYSAVGGSKLGYGHFFTGNTNDTCLNQAAGYDMPIEGQFTIMALAYIANWPSAQDKMIMFKNAKNGQVMQITLGTTGKFRLGIGTKGHEYGTSGVMPTGAWAAFAIRHRYISGTYLTTGHTFASDLFLNGTKYSGSDVTITTLGTSGTTAYVGWAKENVGIWGYDEFRIYDRALSDEEIIALQAEFYNSTHTIYDHEYY